MQNDLQNIEGFTVSHRITGTLLMRGLDKINLEEEGGVSRDAYGQYVSRRRSTRFTFTGELLDGKIFDNLRGHIMPVIFTIKYKRTDIIEILKCGQYIKMQGVGYITQITKNTDTPEITITVVVDGNISIV